MKNNLLKLLLLSGIMLYVNNVYACWSSGWISNCASGSMNIVIKNDTNYTLFYLTKESDTVSITPGEVYTINKQVNDSASIKNKNILFAVSATDTSYTPLDSISASIRYHKDYVCDNQGNCGYNGQGYFHDFKSKHSWLLNSNGVSPAFTSGISLNISLQPDNTYVYDYTMASNNPPSLPPGSNPFGNTEYAPSPYQNN